jgi:choline kinase
MAGGQYQDFETPKQLTVINGECLVDRTIRLLRENGIKDIYITSNDKRFDYSDAPRLKHYNSYKVEDGIQYGYWLDAFFPLFKPTEKVCFMFGDVYYTEEAIRTIVDLECTKNTLFGTSDAKNENHENWGEPFAYKVVDYKAFMEGIEAVKKMQDDGLTKRMPIVWELYRYLNGLDINVQQVLDETYVCVDDGTMDVDTLDKVEMVRKRFEDNE